MGSATSNALLKEKVELLEQMLKGQIEITKIQQAVKAANTIDPTKTQTLDNDAQKAILVRNIFQRIPPGVSAAQPLTDEKQKHMIFAQLYFDERRFIEAGHQLSQLLDTAPHYPNARNLLARCFFFLGNQDRTVEELTFVLDHKKAERREILDALFLLGAAVLESQTPSKKSLNKGIEAWESYIKQAPSSPQKPTVEKGLSIMKKALTVPEGVKLNSRVAQLPVDASKADKLKAQALDLFDTASPKEALVPLQNALKEKVDDPELATALGRTYVRVSDVPKAQETFKSATSRHPDYMPAWHYQGMAFLLGGAPKKAVASWKHVLDNDPSYAAQFQLDRRIAVAEQMSQ
jgi:predicted Zn-dependent protease